MKCHWFCWFLDFRPSGPPKSRMGWECFDLRSEIWDMRADNWDLRPKTWHLRSEIWDLRHKTQDLAPHTRDPRAETWDLRSDTSDLRFETENAKPKIKDFRPETQDQRAEQIWIWDHRSGIWDVRNSYSENYEHVMFRLCKKNTVSDIFFQHHIKILDLLLHRFHIWKWNVTDFVKSLIFALRALRNRGWRRVLRTIRSEVWGLRSKLSGLRSEVTGLKSEV